MSDPRIAKFAEDPRIAKLAEAALAASGVTERFDAAHEAAESEEQRDHIAAHRAGALGAARHQATLFLAMYDAVTAKGARPAEDDGGDPKGEGEGDDDVAF